MISRKEHRGGGLAFSDKVTTVSAKSAGFSLATSRRRCIVNGIHHGHWKRQFAETGGTIKQARRCARRASCR